MLWGILALVGVPSPLAKGRLLEFLVGYHGEIGVCVCVRWCGALGIFGTRSFPASVWVVARLSRHSTGNSGRGAGYVVDLVLGCVLFYFVFVV